MNGNPAAGAVNAAKSPSSAIELALDRLADNITGLHELLDRMERLFQPVLQPLAPTPPAIPTAVPGALQAVEETVSPLQASIDSLNRRLDQACGRAAKIIDRARI